MKAISILTLEQGHMWGDAGDCCLMDCERVGLIALQVRIAPGDNPQIWVPYLESLGLSDSRTNGETRATYNADLGKMVSNPSPQAYVFRALACGDHGNYLRAIGLALDAFPQPSDEIRKIILNTVPPWTEAVRLLGHLIEIAEVEKKLARE